RSSQTSSVVLVDGIDVGGAPVDLERPSGPHEVIVKKSGYSDYRTRVQLEAGQPLELQANLQKASILKKWWFWTTAGVVLTGAVLGVYFGARAAQEPRPDGGGLQWVVDVR